jgi:hypothetical protein
MGTKMGVFGNCLQLPDGQGTGKPLRGLALWQLRQTQGIDAAFGVCLAVMVKCL